MRAHGDYKIVVEGNIVHVFPSGGFNAQGVIELHQELALKAPKNTPWALFEHPCDIAGLTPDAINALISCYQKLSQTSLCGCGVRNFASLASSL